MARTRDPVGHARRRDEFLDVAERLLATKGYEAMSVQDVLRESRTSKGAFYHYFDSKPALLEAVVERMADRVAATLAEVVAEPDVPALAALSRVFAALARWKSDRRDLLLPLVRVWCSDDNAVLRQKLRSGIADRTAPLFADVVARGVREGVFTATHPDETARVIVSLVQDLNDRLGEFLLAAEAAPFAAVERTVAAYTNAIARTLGVTEGEVVLVASGTLRPWFTSNGES